MEVFGIISLIARRSSNLLKNHVTLSFIIGASSDWFDLPTRMSRTTFSAPSIIESAIGGHGRSCANLSVVGSVNAKKLPSETF